MRIDPKAWGVQQTYELGGAEVSAPDASVAAVLEALGAQAESPPPPGVAFARAGRRRMIRGAVEVATEDGAVVPAPGGKLPPDLPCGYHRVVDAGGGTRRLVVAPGRCWLPAGLRAWGWAVQLYALRSRSSWGMGDLGDLRHLMRWSHHLGARMTLVNPLHAAAPALPQQASPYFPTSRVWRNPLYLRIEDVPGAPEAREELEEAHSAGRALNHDRHIDRDAVFRLKMPALEMLWRRFPGDRNFDRFRERNGELLEAFSAHCVLAESFGTDWRRWPVRYRGAGERAVRSWAEQHADRVGFHAWLQWLLDRQLADAALGGGLVQDLAVGSDPGGADAWLWRDVMAEAVRIGAPPDQFNAQGQDWGVAAFDPWRLRAAGYEPFIRTLRAGLRPGGGLRIDHVMGLWRLFWIPPRASSAADGVYVRYPAEDLLDIVALESQRAGAYVIGEDLGTVERGVRRKMAARNMLSYRLLWFERSDPAKLPGRTLAAVTNHDQPTVSGMWSGADLDAQRAAGLDPDERALERVRRRIARQAGLTDSAEPGDVIEAVYRMLARAPSALVGATLEDALEVFERPNHPGTTNELPNWRLALPVPLEDIESDPRPAKLAALLAR
jgi:4-alpha-glucanotransferase